MRRSVADLLIALAILVGAIALRLYTAGAGYKADDTISFDGGWVPSLLLELAIAMAVVLGIQALLVLRAQAWARHRAASALAPFESIDRVALGRLAVVLLLAGGFIAGFTWLGYWIPALVFPPVFSVVFGYRRPVALAVATIALAGGVWFVFTDLLHVQLAPWPEFLAG
ncbi:MAG: tripartite tricarboxylate transporter TctB family protein [Burkholderiaceae bacterium]